MSDKRGIRKNWRYLVLGCLFGFVTGCDDDKADCWDTQQGEPIFLDKCARYEETQ